MKNYTLVKDYSAVENRTPDAGNSDGSFSTTDAPWNDEAGHLNLITNVVIEEGITSVGDRAFTHALNLQNVSLPEGLESVGCHAFYLTDLTSVDLPSTVVRIGNMNGDGGGSFQYTNMTQINLPEGLKTISSSTFRSTPLESIVIPDSVETIGKQAFSYNQNLKSVVIGDGVTTINAKAFDGTSAYVYCQESGHGGKSCANLVAGTGLASDKLKIYTIENGKIKVGSKTYNSLDELPQYTLRRIYTLKEAEAAAGKVNTVKIRYR